MSKLSDLAREAGRAGQSWTDFAFRDDVGALCDTPDNDIDGALAAWEEGEREHRIEDLGWVTLWTDAPADYDSFGTETIESGGPWYGKELRKVIADPRHADYQRDRYGSGLHGSWPEDPRVEAARLAEQSARWKAEDEARKKKHAQDMRWLQSLSDEAFEKYFAEAHDADNRDEPLDDSISQVDRREEAVRRQEIKRSAERKAKWAECAAIIPDGCTILDNGTDGFRSRYNGRWIAGQPTRVLYHMKLTPHWNPERVDDPEEAYFTSDGQNGYTPSLTLTAQRITEGRYKIVAESDVPPRPVVDRFGHENVKKIRRAYVKVKGVTRTVWVSRKNSWDPPEVFDEKGRIVRAKKVREAALRAASESTE